MHVQAQPVKIFDMLIALGTCFMFSLGAGEGLSNTSIIQYLVIFTVLGLQFVRVFLLEERKIDLILISIINFIIFAFLLGGFIYGFSLSDFKGLVGILVIPLMILIYKHQNVSPILYYFVVFFSFNELIILFFSWKYNIFLNIVNVAKIREIFYNWPNYFSMLSFMKIAILNILYQNKVINKGHLVFGSLISGAIVVFSMSRTAMGMLAISFVLHQLLLQKDKRSWAAIWKKIQKTIILALLVVLILMAFSAKDSYHGSTMERTWEARTERWVELYEFIRESPIIGLGFRSVTSFATDIGSSHNDYVDLLTKGGILSVFVIYGYYLSRLWKMFRNRDYAAFSTIIAIFFASLFQNPLKNLSLIVLFSLLIAQSYKKPLGVILLKNNQPDNVPDSFSNPISS